MTNRMPSSKIDTKAGTVTFADGKSYCINDMWFTVKHELALRGLRDMIRGADNPTATYDKLLAGTVPVRGRAAKPATLDPWREAGAHAKAEMMAKALGVRPAPGKRLSDHPDFCSALEAARQIVAKWDKATLAKAKQRIAIMEWHAKITGADQSLDALFSGSDPAEPGQTVLAEAAD